jgi:hypothetical protein
MAYARHGSAALREAQSRKVVQACDGRQRTAPRVAIR